jgi:AcrR family transcriptional regulator
VARPPASSRTRAIARAAVRDELAHVALELFHTRGYDSVTVADIADAAGVSRSTFLRYFSSKDDAVLAGLGTQADLVAAALLARPAEEGIWTALRGALEVVLRPYRDDPDQALTTTRLVMATPALCAARTRQQHGWRPVIESAILQRDPSLAATGLRASVLAALATECLSLAIDAWTASDGSLDLLELLDDAFESVRQTI